MAYRQETKGIVEDGEVSNWKSVLRVVGPYHKDLY